MMAHESPALLTDLYQLTNVYHQPNQPQSLIATEAARCVHAAANRPVVDFAFRRTHGIDAQSSSVQHSRLREETERQLIKLYPSQTLLLASKKVRTRSGRLSFN